MSDAWGQVGEDRLRRLVAEGLSAGQIAEAMRVTRNAVTGKLDRLGLALANARTGHVKIPRSWKQTVTTGHERSAHARQLAVQSHEGPSPPRRFSWQDTP